ncbi:MAG: Hpt domain-containing protein, partial [Xanthomonadales bacterium]|nr:Hpt domain-containing protein [Xanthomonadales bacterium]
ALLFHVAQARTGCKPVDGLRKLFKLEEIIPDRDALLRARGAVTGRDARLFYSIGQAIREEMTSIKDSLDMELRTGRIDSESRTAIVSSLIQLSDTLHMLNLPVPALALQELLPSLELTRDVENFELDSPLLNLAQQLLEVEAVLQKHIQHLGEPIDESEEQGNLGLSQHEHRQILSTMLDEAVATLHQAQEAIRERLDGETDADYVTPLRHISGAMYMAGQMEVSKLTDKLERAFNAALVGAGPKQEEPSVAVLLLTDAVAALELYLTGCRDGQSNNLRFLDIMQDRLEGMPEATSAGDTVAGTVVSLPKRPVAKPAETPEPAAKAPATDARATTRPAAPPSASVAGSEALPSPLDSGMQDIFIEEFDSVDAELREAFQAWTEDPAQRKPLEDIRRGFHTLKGSGRMVGARELGEFAWRIENMLNRVLENKVELSPQVSEVIRMSIAALPLLRGRMLQSPNELSANGVKHLAEFARQLARGELPHLEDLADAIPDSVRSGTVAPAPSTEPSAPTAPVPTEAVSADDRPEPDPTLVQLMSGEIRQYLAALQPFVDAADSDAPVKVSTDQVRTAHSLIGTLSLAPLGDETELAKALEGYLQAQAWANQVPGGRAAEVLRACLQRFEDRLAVLDGAADADSYARESAELIALLTDLKNNIKAGDEATAAKPEPQAADEEPAPEVVEAVSDAEPDTEPGAEPDAEPGLDAEPEFAEHEDAAEAEEAQEDRGELAGVDREILGIFLGESTDVLERCDTILNTWRDRLNDRKLVQNLQREIHTFKGGARMAGLEPLGNLSHAMESLLERIAAGGIPATVAAVQALEEGCDCLNLWVEMLQDGRLPEDQGALKRFRNKVELLTSGPAEVDIEPAAPEPPPPEAAGTAAEDTTAQDAAAQDDAAQDAEEHDAAEEASVRGLAPAPTEIDKLEDLPQGLREITERAPGEEDAPVGAQIRVAADLMDSLVNYSGEISIYRARLEEQLTTVRFNLKEVDQTVARLNEQLRKMEMETEAQMLSRYQHASAKSSSEFDPLELDRFSNIQQLSRALSETVSDLLSLHEMLDDSVRQAESLLSSQSRVSSDLQDGLMQTRMTPFGSAAPRLRRLVRSAAAETGKQARLQLLVGGTSDRLDRNVLERITAPMEHMLRNAVVHGLESPEQRKKAGKPEEGLITVTVSAEATEFVIRVQDDGAGLDLEAIRNRAIERGLIGRSDHPSPRQLARFILESGFSTSGEVTGLAGRGVGMDVVNSEIKQIGGSLEIATEPGKGSRFTVRIPFSLAVMQAIGISAGGHPYLVPLNSVAGVGRMAPSDYNKLIKRDNPTYEFAGEQYPLIEIGPLLGMKPDPLDSDNVTLLMIDTGEQRAAFRVTSLRGHQEVVVKPIGPQISSIPGILGATISGDGRVVIILDVGPLIRHGASRAVEIAEPPREESEDVRPPLVMVIDDSITMRKVTTR